MPKSFFNTIKFSLLTGLAVLLIQITFAGEVREITVFSPEDPTTILTDNPLPETVFKDDIRPKPADYTGEYFSSVSEVEDQGANQSIRIQFKKGKPEAIYTWKSWNDSADVPPIEGRMSNVFIVSNQFSGRQSVSGQSTIRGRFVTFAHEGKSLKGLLDEDANLLWIKATIP